MRALLGRALWITIVVCIATSAAGLNEDHESPRAARASLKSASDYAPDSIVARVDGTPMTLGELVFRFAVLPQEIRNQYLAQNGPLAAFLEDLTENLVIVREAEALELDNTAKARLLMQIKREEALLDLYARHTVLSHLNEEHLRQRYEETRDRLTTEEKLRLNYILIAKGSANEGLAATEALREDILGGADFAEVARRASIDTSSKRGGDLGWVDPDDLVPEVKAAATTLPLDTVSEVIESPLGYHLVVVTERRSGHPLPFETVRELLFQEAVGENQPTLARTAQAARHELLENHDVELYLDHVPW